MSVYINFYFKIPRLNDPPAIGTQNLFVVSHESGHGLSLLRKLLTELEIVIDICLCSNDVWSC